MRNLHSKNNVDFDDFCFRDGKNDVFLPLERTNRGPNDLETICLLLKKIDFDKFERVSLVPEFRRFADARQWKNRRDFGYAWRTNPFDFVRKEYGQWIDAASEHDLTLMQSDILVVDKPLWDRLQQDISKHGLPSDIELPAEKQARLESIEDPEERKLQEAYREYERRRNLKRKATRDMKNN